MTKNSAISTSGAFVSIIGHITRADLQSCLDQADIANGFANRFLWVLSRRSKLLPDGGHVPDNAWADFLDRMKSAIDFARGVTSVERDQDARQRWREIYESLSAEEDGHYGSVTSRSEAQVTRLSVLYAVLDKSSIVRRCDLDAALALWRYCDDSARVIFSGGGRPRLAEQILAMLSGYRRGLTRSEISNFLGRNVEASRISRALQYLEIESRISKQIEETGGRPAERWSLNEPAERPEAEPSGCLEAACG